MPPFEIKPIAGVLTPRWSAAQQNYLFQLGEAAEIILVIGAWVYLFTRYQSLGGYTENEIITYLVAGSVLGVMTGWLEHLWIEGDLRDGKNELVRTPFRYLGQLLKRDWYKAVLPFLVHVGFQSAVIVFFRERLVFSFNGWHILAISGFVILSFIFDFLLSYWYRASSYWWIASPAKREFFDRIKKILSGVYFPLNILPAIVLNITLLLPFAYGFFVPAQIYLGKFSWNLVFIGFIIQIFWIMVIYSVIKRTARERESSPKIA